MELSAQEATLIAATLAGIFSFFALIFSIRAMERKDRSLLLWEREILRVTELEEQVARIKHMACGTTAAWSDKNGMKSFSMMQDQFGEFTNEFALNVGRYARYPGLVVDANRVVNKSDKIINGMKDGTDISELEEEVETLFNEFLLTVDVVTHRNDLFPIYLRRKRSKHEV